MNCEELDWLRTQYGMEICPETHPSVFCFPLIWGIFEREVCLTKGNPPEIECGFVQGLNLLSPEHFAEARQYFQTRYVQQNHTNHRFAGLRLNEKLVSAVSTSLLETRSIIAADILPLLLIANRVRNNYLHGLKERWELVEQNELFSFAGRVVMTFMEQTRGKVFQKHGDKPCPHCAK
jgi:hypothetical protein